MNPKLAEQYFERAEALFKEGAPDEALLLLDTLDEAFPNSKSILFARARTLAALGRRDEALALCDDLIARFDHSRARDLKGSIESNRELSARSGPVAGSRPRWMIHAGMAFCGAVVLAVAGLYAYQTSRAGLQFAPPAPAEVDARLQARADARKARALAPATESGREHPPEEWRLVAVNGVPRWKPGIYREVPCLRAPERSLDVYIPMAYQEKPDARFPVVVIQMPRPNPGFIDLEKWAEARDVILVVVNSSHNGSTDRNVAAQDHALETVAETLRVDRRLGFAIGMSGGAKSSWRMICRYPEYFQGVVMMGMAGLHSCRLPTHVRIGYIHGEDEPNNWGKTSGIYYEIPVLRARGHPIRESVVPGGHVTGPAEERIAMLEWMVSDARHAVGLPHPRRTWE